ncbi:MAG TPA: hypothetical protein DDX92_03470 [Flavobacteriales bacterium]|jgi:hypothetical protein|nr:hypothetical protein [Flavobacteriales bacterium]
MKSLYTVLILSCIPFISYSFRYAASINFQHVQGREYVFEAIVYADSGHYYPEIVLEFDTTDVFLNLDTAEDLGHVWKAKYKGGYTFPSDGTYLGYLVAGSRKNGIANIPNSIHTDLTLAIELEVALGTSYSSSHEEYSLIDSVVLNVPYNADFSAVDDEGDSLVYHLNYCRDESGGFISGYYFPFSTSFFTLDSVSGGLNWQSPSFLGNQSVLVRIEEWRSGQFISSREREHLFVVSNASGIHGRHSQSVANLYPNPAVDEVFLELPVPSGQNVQVEVYTSTGVLMETTALRPQGTDRLMLDAERWNTGWYILRIQTENKVYAATVYKK